MNTCIARRCQHCVMDMLMICLVFTQLVGGGAEEVLHAVLPGEAGGHQAVYPHDGGAAGTDQPDTALLLLRHSDPPTRPGIVIVLCQLGRTNNTY